MSEHYANLRQQVMSYGLSDASARWLIKALHPPGPGGGVSPPTGHFTPSVKMDVRPAATLTYTGPADTWDCCIVQMPGDGNAFVAAIGPGGFDFITGTPTQVVSAGTSDYAAPAVPLSTRTAAGVCTVSSATSNTIYPLTRPMSARLAYKSLTVHMTASSLYDGGSVIATQIPTRYSRSSSLALAPVTTPGANRYCAENVYSFLPLSENEITRMSPASHLGPAKEGVYLPLRFTSFTRGFQAPPVVDGLHITDGVGVTNSTNGRAVTSLNPVILTNSTARSHAAWVSPFWWSGQQATATGAYPDTILDDMCTTVVIFRGLDKRATLTVQAYVGIDMVVEDESSLAPMATPPAPLDPQALLAYSLITADMKYVYPARFNSLGLLLPAISAALRAVAPVAIPMAKRAVGALVKRLPGVAAIAAPAAAAMLRAPRQRTRSVSTVRSRRARTPATPRRARKRVTIARR